MLDQGDEPKYYENALAFVKGELLYTSVKSNNTKVYDEYSGRFQRLQVEDFKQIVYDPYQFESFVYADSKEPIFTADTVHLNNKGEVYVN